MAYGKLKGCNMEQVNLMEVAQAVSQSGRAVLWLGSSWTTPDSEEDLALLAGVDWLGLWSDSKCARLPEVLREAWERNGKSRKLIEVPDKLEDVLGAHFKFADVAPYMFLNGRGDAQDPLDDVERLDSRIDKTRELARAGDAILLVGGTKNCEELFKIAAEAGRRANDLYRIVLTGLSAEQCNQALPEFIQKYPTVALKLVFSDKALIELIRDALTLRISPIAPLGVRIGEHEIRLDPLLEREPPITQDFAVLTTRDIDPGESANETRSDLLLQLFSGTSRPWRSIARGLVWDERPTFKAWRTHLQESIEIIRKGDRRVVVIDAPAESGSGLTVLLSQLAVFGATQRCPALFHVSSDPSLAYSRLRTFLTDLYRDVTGPSALTPAIIFFDADSVWGDFYGQIAMLAPRLNRDGRRAIIVRAKPVDSEWFSDLPVPKGSKDIAYTAFRDTLRERLDDTSALQFAGWISREYRHLNDAELPGDWYEKFKSLSDTSGCPFFLTLSILLVERYREAARLGMRLVGRLWRVVDALEAERNLKTEVVLDEGNGIAKALRIGVRLGLSSCVESSDMSSAFAVLSAMACLRIPVPRRILGSLAGIATENLFTATTLLEKAGLASSKESPSLPYIESGLSSAHGYRTRQATVQLAHYAFGRIVLDWLTSEEGQHDASKATQCQCARDLIDTVRRLHEKDNFFSHNHPFPIELLQPIFARLRPGNTDDREFAELLVQRFLRVQREKAGSADRPYQERSYRRWQWDKRDDVLQAFDWLRPELIEESASILHSRAITRAKCTRNERPAQARPLYMGAEDDLVAALEMENIAGSDNPVHILSTLGMVYVHWASMEREHGDPENRVEELDRLADDTLREAKMLQLDSAYPSFHLATHKIDTADHLKRTCPEGFEMQVADNLTQALELLSVQPEPGFQAEWDQLFTRGVLLLKDQSEVIEKLKEEHRVLGWALEALIELNGEFPREPDIEIDESNLAKAWGILEDAQADSQRDHSPVADLLRYAIFSARQLRQADPAYDRRLDLILKIKDTPYMRDPIWLYDYGMLCYQNGKLREGSAAFRELRRGQRFFFVPNDRAVAIAEGPHTRKPKEFLIQVQSADRAGGQAWGRIIDRVPFPDPVPFAARSFESRDEAVRVRGTLPCIVTIRPAGPFAEPVPRR